MNNQLEITDFSNEISLDGITTEERNLATSELDSMSPLEIVQAMNKEDENVPRAIKPQLENIAKCVEIAVEAIENNGRIIYIGAGTSGRIGVMDAVECPPTFGTNSNQVVGLIAGGSNAFVKAVEGAEDKKNLAVEDLEDICLNNNDIVIGLAASGRTPYVIGGLEYAKSKGCHTVGISCNKDSQISRVCDIPIEIDVGPEVLTGSTRLKAGSAQKMVLNMISTATMVRLGKVYKNYMVDVQPTNEKLKKRAENILMEIVGIDRTQAQRALEITDNNVKNALIVLLCGCSNEEAKRHLRKAKGHVNIVLESLCEGDGNE